jgi:DNA polymerase I
VRYLTYVDAPVYPVVLLTSRLNREEIQKTYCMPYGLDPADLCAIEFHQVPGKKKISNSQIKDWLAEELIPTLQDIKAEYLLVTDATYFKVLTKTAKVDPHIGYVLPCALGPWDVIYVPSHMAVFYDPEKVTARIKLGMTALVNHRLGAYQNPGEDIIQLAHYPKTTAEIGDWLRVLLNEGCDLTCDLETFSLKHHTSGIGTVSLCWSQHEGIAFPVDACEIQGATTAPWFTQKRNEPVRALLRDFFERFTGKLIFHGASFDAYILIAQLWMKDILDTVGLLHGLKVILRNWDCTKLIAYFATNSCAGNVLRLKVLAQEFAGNWAVDDIEDITKTPLDKLLEYNLVDGLSTWFVYNKHWPTVVKDNQQEIYETLFKPGMVDIIQMQLTGLPVNMQRVLEVEAILQAIQDASIKAIAQSPVIQEFTYNLQCNHVTQRNLALKKKQISFSDDEVRAVQFNPNSGRQLQQLLYDQLELPIIELTKSKEPSTSGATLKALINHASHPTVVEFLTATGEYKAINKLLTSFIPAFKEAAQGSDGWHYLFGNFNLGGTVSGRLSSSDPNLQNLPANVQMAISQGLIQRFGPQLDGYIKKGKLDLGKLMKSCFEAPPGWIFAGLDFASLEDRISALTTKDPNKLKVYTDGYDGHSLRAYTYWPEKMPDIDPNSVVSINSIQDKYGTERGGSKAPTFALTYQGTWLTLVKKCGFDPDQAKQIEARFKELYKVSIEWVSAKLDEAAQVGYVTAAFGLRVRTPLLHQVIRGTSKTPHEAEAEGRTAGNALGQSWCLLNTRAGVEFNAKVRVSEWKLAIKPCAHIHDAQYFLIQDDIGAIQFTNHHLVTAVKWQDHPEIAHPEVKLGGELSLFYPNWAHEITIPNDASEEEIMTVVEKSLAPVKQKAA